MNNRSKRSLRFPLAAGGCVVLCLLLVVGCGQKGDLYFPNDKTAVVIPLKQS